MTTLRRLVLVAVVVALATACLPARKDPAQVTRILVVGDSLMHGAYAAPGIDDHLPTYFPNAQIISLGGPASSPMDGYDPNTGWSDWAGQVNHWLYNGFDADIIVIQGCCNDFTTAAAWRGSLDAIVSKGRQYDPGGDRRIVMVTTPRIVPGTGGFWVSYGVDKMIENTNAVIRQYPDVAIADLDFAWSVNWGPVWDVPGVGVVRYVDGLHYSTVGAREAARIVSTT